MHMAANADMWQYSYLFVQILRVRVRVACVPLFACFGIYLLSLWHVEAVVHGPCNLVFHGCGS